MTPLALIRVFVAFINRPQNNLCVRPAMNVSYPLVNL